MSSIPFRGEMNDEYSTLGYTNSAGSGIFDGWLLEGYSANRKVSYKHGICGGFCALERSRDRCPGDFGGNWTDSSGCHGHLAMVNAGCGYWPGLDDDRSDDHSRAAWGVYEDWCQRGTAAVGLVCRVRAFCGCSVFGVGELGCVRWKLR